MHIAGKPEHLKKLLKLTEDPDPKIRLSMAKAILKMGHGSFYNHSYTPNAKCLIFPLKYEDDYYVMKFEAIKPIKIRPINQTHLSFL